MHKLSTFIKSSVALLLCAIIFISGGITVFADKDDDDSSSTTRENGNYTAMAGALMKTYANGGQGDLELDEITPNEFRAWAVLLSNYIIPFSTPLNKIGTKEDEEKTWENFLKTWNKSGKTESELTDKLLTKYTACIDVNSDNESLQQLFYKEEGKEIKATVGSIISQEGIKADRVYYWKNDNDIVNVLNTKNYTVKAMLSYIRMANPQILNWSKGDKNVQEAELYIDCFGDICYILNKKVYAVVPACLNSRTFTAYDEKGDKLYVNNMFFLSNFLSSDDIDENIKLQGENDELVSLFTNRGDINIDNLRKMIEHYNGGLFKAITYGSGDVPLMALGAGMHMSPDSMLPFYSIVASAGMDSSYPAKCWIPIVKEPKREDGSYQISPTGDGVIQPLWSLMTLKLVSENKNNNFRNVVAIAGRSDIIDPNSDKSELFYGYEKGVKDFYENRRGGIIPFLEQNGDALWTNNKDIDEIEGSDFKKATNFGKSNIESGINDSIAIKNIDNIAAKINEDKSETDYLIIYNGGSFPIGGESDSDSTVGWDSKERQAQNALTLFQVPLDDVVSKIGIFDTIGSDKDSGPVKAIDYVNTDSDDTVLQKTSTESFKVPEEINDQNYLIYENDADAKVQSLYTLPEYLYTLDLASDFRDKDKSYQFNKYGLIISNKRGLFSNIYWGYIEDIVGIKAEDIQKAAKNGTSLQESDIKAPTFDWLPEMPSANFANALELQLSESDKEEQDAEASQDELNEKQANIIDWVFKILSGGAGEVIADAGNYVINWLKSLVDNLFLGMHNAMVGIDISNDIVGSVEGIGNSNQSGVYSTAVGYITTPTFNSLPVTSWIYNNFTFVYVILLIIVVIILIFMVITRSRRITQAIGVFIVMAFVLILPANLLNSSINVSNMAAENIYSEKFMYWAVMQHAESLLNQSSATNDTQANLVDNLSRQEESTKTGGVTLKWLSPKKWGITERLNAVTKNTKGMRLFLYFAGDTLDGEDYSYNVSDDGVYTYRTYSAIFTEAKGMRQEIENDTTIKTMNKEDNGVAGLNKISSGISGLWMSNNGGESYGAISSTDTSGKSKATDTSVKLSRNSSNGNITVPETNLFRITSVRGDTLFRPVLGGQSVDKNGKSKTYPSGYYDSYYGSSGILSVKNNNYKSNARIYSIYANKDLVSAIMNFNVKNVKWQPTTASKACGLWLSDTGEEITGDSGDASSSIYKTGVRAFLDYSESPYYYFYNVLSEAMIETENGSKIDGATDFLTLLLSDEFFDVTDEKSNAYGQIKDYLDLEGLFTYVIPLMDYANQDAKQYFDKWGTDVEKSDYDKEEDYNNHKYQNQAVWNLYSPWVHGLMDANNNAQEANSGYGQVTILEACNPAEYNFNNRPMAFSPAEKVLRGYEDMDLTQVEYKLQKVLIDTKEDFINLINYKDLTGESIPGGNDILISAAAMLATFNFNQEFSDTGFMSTNIQLYPVSFELKNMNYDAYLRLILGNSMGVNQVKLMRSDSSDKTVYDTFVHNTSVISALVLILVDIMGVFIIPIMKILLIVVIFALALALSISCIINAPEKLLPTILNTFVLPLLGMIAIFTVHAVAVSWFIGEGTSGIIDTHSIAVTTGDPTITLLLLLILDVVSSILMWKLLKFAAISTAKYIKATFDGVKDMAKNTFGSVVSSIGAVGSVVAGAAGVAGVAGGLAKVASAPVKGAAKLIGSQIPKKVKVTNKSDEDDSAGGKGSTGNKGGTGGTGGNGGTGGTGGTGSKGGTGGNGGTGANTNKGGNSGTGSKGGTGGNGSKSGAGGTAKSTKATGSASETYLRSIDNSLKGIERSLGANNKSLPLRNGMNKGNVSRNRGRQDATGRQGDNRGQGYNGTQRSGNNRNDVGVRFKVDRRTGGDRATGGRQQTSSRRGTSSSSNNGPASIKRSSRGRRSINKSNKK